VQPQPFAILCIAIDDQHARRRACPPGFHPPTVFRGASPPR
jgi:hypothetical protein